jgi:hypothetical protein
LRTVFYFFDKAFSNRSSLVLFEVVEEEEVEMKNKNKNKNIS